MIMTDEQIRAAIAESGGRGIIIRNMDNEDYHKSGGISSSDAKDLVNGSLQKWLDKKKKTSLPTKAKDAGTMIHNYNLEPELFSSRYVAGDTLPKAPSRATTEGKNDYKTWCEKNYDTLMEKYKGKIEDPYHWQLEWVAHFHPQFKGKVILASGQMEMLEGIKKNIESHPKLSLLMKKEHCETEVAMFWICPTFDIVCKCKPDIMNYEWPCLLDLKSCENSDYDAFETNVTNWDMPISAAWYLWGAEICIGKKFDDFILIPCEREEPYIVDWYPVDPASLEIGESLGLAARMIYRRYLDDLKNNTKKSDLRNSKNVKYIGYKPYALNKLSQVIFKHDLHKMGLEGKTYGGA